MKMLVLDVVDRVAKSGKPYCRAALRGSGKNGDFLFVATVPDGFVAGETYDNKVIFDGKGGAFVLPY